ncbi:hypothetical protein HRbin15_02698 [bacterium HR15]|nr:hypothetical protein HRbin15_02698 [bacterium HR15]
MLAHAQVEGGNPRIALHAIAFAMLCMEDRGLHALCDELADGILLVGVEPFGKEARQPVCLHAGHGEGQRNAPDIAFRFGQTPCALLCGCGDLRRFASRIDG